MASYVGYGILAIGLVILLITFLFGYNLYATANTNSLYPSSAKIGTGSLNASFGNALQSMVSTVNGSLYTLIAIVVLFLFASIGYKIADLGISMIFKEKELQRKR